METQSENVQSILDFLENLWIALPGTCKRFYPENMRMDVEIKMSRKTGEGLPGEQKKPGPICYNAPVMHGRTKYHGDRDSFQPGDMVQILFNSRSTEKLFMNYGGSNFIQDIGTAYEGEVLKTVKQWRKNKQAEAEADAARAARTRKAADEAMAKAQRVLDPGSGATPEAKEQAQKDAVQKEKDALAAEEQAAKSAKELEQLRDEEQFHEEMYAKALADQKSIRDGQPYPEYKRFLHENDAIIMGGHTPDQSVAWPGGRPSKAPPGLADCKILWFTTHVPYLSYVKPNGDMITISHYELFIVSTLFEVRSPDVLFKTAAIWKAIVGALFLVECPLIVLDGETHVGGWGGKRIHRLYDIDSDGDLAITAASRAYAV